MTAKIYTKHENVYLLWWEIMNWILERIQLKLKWHSLVLLHSVSEWSIPKVKISNQGKCYLAFYWLCCDLSISWPIIPLTPAWKLLVEKEVGDNSLCAVSDFSRDLYVCICNEIFISYSIKNPILFMSYLLFLFCWTSDF